MKKVIFYPSILAAFLFFSANVYSTIRYVKTTGSGSGASWVDASSDLQLTINNSSEGDEIWVAAGTYKPNRKANATETVTENDRNNAFVLKSGVKIYGGFGGTETLLSQRNWTTNSTILSGDLGTTGNNSDNAYHVVISSGAVGTAELNGFTIKLGYAYNSSNITVNGYSFGSGYGGGILCTHSSPTFTNLNVTSNYADYFGGGIYNDTALPTITNVTVSSNIAGQRGGGMFNTSSSPTITNSIFKSNAANSGTGGAISNTTSSSPIITNTLIFKNTSNQNGGGIFSESSSTPQLINSTIVYNTTSNTWAAGGLDGAFTVKNSILWGNKGGGISYNYNGSVTFNYCLLENGTLSGTSIISNSTPLFTDVTTDDYHLKGWSPGVNTGSNLLNSSSTDLDGNPRKFNNGTIDLGPFEYQSSDTSKPVATTILYVKKGSSGTGTSWANAYGELADALAYSNESGTVAQIWVAAGTYYPLYYAGSGGSNQEKSFVMQKDLKIYGGFAGTETALSQRNWKTNVTILSGNSTSYHVVIATGDAGMGSLDGFTITGGNAGSWGTTIINSYSSVWQYGGGIYCCTSSPTLSNLIVKSNSSVSYAAAIYCTSTSNPTFNNTLIYNNSPGQGFAVMSENTSTPIFNNATIVNNNGGGLNGNFALNNSIVWNNSGTNNVSGTVTYNSCLIGGGTVSGSSIISNSDPSFVNTSTGDYHLLLSSPAKKCRGQ